MLRLNKITFVILFMIHFCDSLTDLDKQSAQEMRDNKKALMNSLGLKYVPRTVPRQSDFLLRRYSAPKFMIGLFKEVSNTQVHHRHAAPGFYNNRSNYRTGEHYEMERKYLDENKVDTVISFFKYDHDKSWNRIHQEFKLKFKTRFSSQEDIVQGGELKIFKRLPRNRSMAHGKCSVSVYLIMPEANKTQLIDKRDVHAWEPGWQTFNVTAAIKLWALFPLANHGLRVVVHHDHEELSPHLFGIVGARGNLGKRPYLVGFVTTTRVFPTFTPEFVAPSRERRAARGKWKSANNVANNCKLKKFFVNFKEIGLHYTIIAPKGYDMSFCQGICVYPFDSIETTSHAVLQSLYHLYDDSFPEPCCVPGGLKSESLLFFDDDRNIILKQHPNMIATSCVCN